MSDATYAVADSTNTIVNIVIWDGESPVEWPAETTITLVPEGAYNYQIGQPLP